jgi:L-alanine-DL-glutamate epimerase-like enolase superfamily enzyme
MTNVWQHAVAPLRRLRQPSRGDKLHITRVETLQYRMPLKRAYGAAKGVTRAGNNLLVRVTATAGRRTIEGVGECQPRHRLTGDGARGGDDAWQFLTAATSQLSGHPLRVDTAAGATDDIRALMADLADLAVTHANDANRDKPFRGTLLGIEIALLDTAARALDLELSELLGKRRDEIGISASMVSSSTKLEEIEQRIRQQHRYPMSRVRGIGNLDHDWRLLELVAATNRAVGRSKPILAGINEGFDLDQGATFVDGVVERMARGDLPPSVVLEGVLPKDDVISLPQLQRRADEACRAAGGDRQLDLRIMPDEGVWDVADLEKINAFGGCRALNIKAPRAGGLLASLDLANAAVEADPDIHICVSGMVGTSDLTAFALHNLARSLPRVDYLTAVPPSNVEVRICSPRARYRSQDSNIIARQKSKGVGTQLVDSALEPYVTRRADSSDRTTPARRPDPEVEALRALKLSTDAKISEMLAKNFNRRAIADGGTPQREKAEAILDFAEPRHVTHMMARLLEKHGISLPSGLSFRTIMLEQSEARQVRAFRPGWLLDNKTTAYAFVDLLGVTRPRSDRTVRRIADVAPEAPIIIKPVRATGSTGVHAVFALDRIVHLRNGKVLASWDEMLKHADWLMAEERTRPVPDRWMVEELIFENAAAQRPAGDLKFYAFYGEIVLIQESRREEGLQVCFWTPDGERVVTGRYEDKLLTDGLGVTAEQITLAATISAEIPVPFMRIDLLRGENGLVFGEFTPRPGHFDELNDEWDRRFGEAWVRAEGRIISDVLDGKRFSEFAEAIGRSAKAPGAAG